MQKLHNVLTYINPIGRYRQARLLSVSACLFVYAFSAICSVNSHAQNTEQKKERINKKKSSEVITITSTVTGNQEQPNEIYIVPWKSEIDRTILYQTLDTRLENVFGHIERREHIRQLDLIKSLSETKAVK